MLAPYAGNAGIVGKELHDCLCIMRSIYHYYSNHITVYSIDRININLLLLITP